VSGILNDKSIEREVIRIVLRNGANLIRKKAYCMACGRYIFSYYDEMSIIVEGATEPQARQIEVTCFGCKVVYLVC
jgi:hypothetical protein